MPCSCHGNYQNWRQRCPTLYLLGLLSYWAGWSLYLYVIPVVGFLGLCLPTGPWSDTVTGFPLSWHVQIVGAGPQP